VSEVKNHEIKNHKVIGILGVPNAGKSTLFNDLLQIPISAVSSKPQTTRQSIRGRIQHGETMLDFVDSPGWLREGQGLNEFLVNEARHCLKEAQGFIICMGPKDRASAILPVAELLTKSSRPFIVVQTKKDLGDINEEVGKFLALHPVKLIKHKREAVSSREIILDALAALPVGSSDLKPGEMDADEWTSHSEKEIASELIREQCFKNLGMELPFQIAVVVRKFEEQKKLAMIYADIWVSKESQKAIVIGKGASMIRKIGTSARERIEPILGRKTFLDLKVIVEPAWHKNPSRLRELGYSKQAGLSS
jgi:GTPase